MRNGSMPSMRNTYAMGTKKMHDGTGIHEKTKRQEREGRQGGHLPIVLSRSVDLPSARSVSLFPPHIVVFFV